MRGGGGTFERRRKRELQEEEEEVVTRGGGRGNFEKRNVGQKIREFWRRRRNREV